MASPSDRPIHTWDPRPRLLVLIVVLVIPVLLIGLWMTLQYGPLYVQPGCTGKGCTPPIFYLLIGSMMAVTMVVDLFLERKLEFFESFARVKGRRGSADQDIPYSQWTVGYLIPHLFSHYFVMSATTPSGKTLLFHVMNKEVPEPKGATERKTLYDWVGSTEVERETMTPEVLRAMTYRSRMRYLAPLGILLAIFLLAVPVASTFGGFDLGGQGLNVWIAGFVILLAILVYRGVENFRRTGR